MSNTCRICGLEPATMDGVCEFCSMEAEYPYPLVGYVVRNTRYAHQNNFANAEREHNLECDVLVSTSMQGAEKLSTVAGAMGVSYNG